MADAQREIVRVQCWLPVRRVAAVLSTVRTPMIFGTTYYRKSWRLDGDRPVVKNGKYVAWLDKENVTACKELSPHGALHRPSLGRGGSSILHVLTYS